MSNGETLKVLEKIVEKGDELSVKQFRQFMIAIALEARRERGEATTERRSIKRMVYDKTEELKDQIDCVEDQVKAVPTTPLSCQQAITNKDELDRIRDEEIPALRKTSKITDALLVVGTVIASALGLRE